VVPCSMECYGIGEMPARTRRGQWTSGGSHGRRQNCGLAANQKSEISGDDDTDSDGASLTGPQPYEGDKREFPRCVAGSLRVRVGSSNATLGGDPMVGFHVLQGVEEVNLW
jgi:hypothetical protein